MVPDTGDAEPLTTTSPPRSARASTRSMGDPSEHCFGNGVAPTSSIFARRFRRFDGKPPRLPG